MQVTNVKNIRKLNGGGILAFVDIEFDEVFTSKGWRIFAGREEQNYDLGFPSEIDKSGKTDDNGKPKYWPTIWVDFKTDEGKKLMDHIKEKVFAKFEEGSSTKLPNKNKLPRPEDFNDDKIPF